MLIEVTKKEAIEIYSQRYFDSKGKVIRYLPIVMLLVALIAGVSIMSFVHDWLGLAVFIALFSPSMFMARKITRASGKYARGQIEEQR